MVAVWVLRSLNKQNSRGFLGVCFLLESTRRRQKRGIVHKPNKFLTKEQFRPPVAHIHSCCLAVVAESGNFLLLLSQTILQKFLDNACLAAAAAPAWVNDNRRIYCYLPLVQAHLQPQSHRHYCGWSWSHVGLQRVSGLGFKSGGT